VTVRTVTSIRATARVVARVRAVRDGQAAAVVDVHDAPDGTT